MPNISHNLRTIGAKIVTCCKRVNRPISDVQLLAVSKRHSTDAIKQAYDSGQHSFGENYVQELVEKSSALSALDIEWHFIGAIQSNKSKEIATHASWVHTIERLKIARRLSDQRPVELGPLNVCLQVNVNNEASKSGISLGELESLAEAVSALPNLTLRGLMAIPEASTDVMTQQANFALLAEAKARLNAKGYALDTLSMGMSNDMPAAIAEGATIVRIGTAIFGRRT